jgi:hypothetical protein
MKLINLIKEIKLINSKPKNNEELCDFLNANKKEFIEYLLDLHDLDQIDFFGLEDVEDENEYNDTINDVYESKFEIDRGDGLIILDSSYDYYFNFSLNPDNLHNQWNPISFKNVDFYYIRY